MKIQNYFQKIKNYLNRCWFHPDETNRKKITALYFKQNKHDVAPRVSLFTICFSVLQEFAFLSISFQFFPVILISKMHAHGNLHIDAEKKSYQECVRFFEQGHNFLSIRDRKKFLLQKVGIFCCCLRK